MLLFVPKTASFLAFAANLQTQAFLWLGLRSIKLVNAFSNNIFKIVQHLVPRLTNISFILGNGGVIEII